MRTMDHAFLQEIANRPDVRPTLGGGEGFLDLSQIISRPGNYCFVNQDGGFLVVRLAPGTYEVHTIFGAAKNTRDLLELMQNATEYMFIETDCVVLQTKVAATNEGARWLCGMNGFEKTFERKDAWADGVDLYYYDLPLDRWARACYPTLQPVGVLFHEALEEARTSRGLASVSHRDDDVHDLMVGLAYRMIAAGNTAKAAATYNKWALLCGYRPMSVIWEQPVVVDTGDAVIQMRNGQMEFLSCR